MSVDPITMKLQTLKASVDAARTEKAKAEARLEELNKQKTQLLSDLQTLGVAPDQLDAEIARLEAERDRLMAEAEQLLQGA